MYFIVLIPFERLVDEVIELCCPDLKYDQAIRGIVKEMVEVNNCDRNQFNKTIKVKSPCIIKMIDKHY